MEDDEKLSEPRSQVIDDESGNSEESCKSSSSHAGLNISLPQNAADLLFRQRSLRRPWPTVEKVTSLERKLSEEDSFNKERRKELVGGVSPSELGLISPWRGISPLELGGISPLELGRISPFTETTSPETTDPFGTPDQDFKIEMEEKEEELKPKRTSIKISLIAAKSPIIFPDQDEHDNDEKEEEDAPPVIERRVRIWDRLSKRSFNRVGNGRPSSDERNMRSAKQIRNMRKKVSVTSRGKAKTSQANLAMAVVEGNLQDVEDIVDAYVALHSREGFRTVTSYRYDMDPRTLLITCIEKPLADKIASVSPHGIAADMYSGLSALHLACAFDQEQVLAYFLKFGSSVMQLRTPSGQSLLHTCAWFGTAAPLMMLVAAGAEVNEHNAREQQPLHLAAINGHVICAKILISAGAELESEDEHGNTPLHEAIESVQYDCAQELVNYDVDVNKTNWVNGTALHYASTKELVALLMSNGADPNIEIEELPGSGTKKTAFKMFLRTMPEGCNEILTNKLKSNGMSLGAKELEISYEYDVFLKAFQRYPEAGEICSLSDIVEVDLRDLLKHPVSESFLHMKWLLVRNYFRAYLTFYLIFLVALTCLILLNFSPIASEMTSNAKNITSWVCFIIVVVTLILLTLKNVFLMCYSLRLYFDTMPNFVELLMISFITVFLFLYYLPKVSEKTDAVVHFAALSLFMSWFNFTLLQGKLPSGGIYINMIVGISKDFLRFFLLYTSSLIAFALCFHIVSHHLDNFKDPITSILCIVSMMVGELDFTTGFTPQYIKYDGTTQIIYVLFLLFVSIVIMNLLVGLAISNITSQFQSAGVYRLKMTVLLIQMIEKGVGVAKKICPCLVRDSHLFSFLLRAQQWERDMTKVDSLAIYVYPNDTKNEVFVKDKHGNRKKTGFVLPPWIMTNTYKYLQQDHTGSAMQAASEKRRQEDRFIRLASEVRSMKKDFHSMRNDIKTVASFIKGTSNRASTH